MRGFMSIVGHGQVERQTKSGLPYWRWVTTTMDDTREVLLMISPFFSGKSLKNAAELLSKVENNVTWRLKFPTKALALVKPRQV